ncbi:MAG: iron ABC transporter substrate-binding protein, partial [Actinomycetota bacterium]|nr:iron ABC transporter substrate-binding protein [Actinomycetota bacterium]
MRRKTFAILCGVALATAIALAGCGGSSAGSGPTITLYNSQHEQTTAALIKEFTKQTGINVRVLN